MTLGPRLWGLAACSLSRDAPAFRSVVGGALARFAFFGAGQSGSLGRQERGDLEESGGETASDRGAAASGLRLKHRVVEAVFAESRTPRLLVLPAQRPHRA